MSDHICTGDHEIMSLTPSLNMHHDTVINVNPMDAGDHDFASWLNPRVMDNLISQHYDEEVKIQHDALSDAAHRSIPTPTSPEPPRRQYQHLSPKSVKRALDV